MEYRAVSVAEPFLDRIKRKSLTANAGKKQSQLARYLHGKLSLEESRENATDIHPEMRTVNQTQISSGI